MTATFYVGDAVTVKGYQCWFCARRFVKPGTTPTRWVEFFCGRPDCNEQEWRWSP